MTPRTRFQRHLRCWSWIAALLAASAASPLDAAGDGPLSFVVILADDLGAGELSCYGHRQHATPHLDRLAKEGMRFETCWATPLCTPSRVLLMTGRYAHRTGWFQLIGRPLTPRPDSPFYELADRVTFSSLLDAQGYVTAMAGKWQLPGALPDLVHECGFDEYRMWAYRRNLPKGVQHEGRWEDKRERTPARYWDPCILEDGEYRPAAPSEYGPDLYCDFLVDFIRRNRGTHFLAYYPMCLAHRPWEPTPAIGKPGETVPGDLASYVAYTDHLVGRVLRALDELQLREETLVVFTADNGTQGRGKAEVSERGVRVPLIVSCPGTVKPGVVSPALVSLADVFPTLLEWAGAKVPAGHEIDGRSLVPVLEGGDEEHRPWVYSYLGTSKIVRDRHWILDSRGRLYDTFSRRDGVGYEEHTAEGDPDPEAEEARRRLGAVLEGQPGPEALAEHLRQPGGRKRPRR